MIQMCYRAFAMFVVEPIYDMFDVMSEAYKEGLSNGEMTDACTTMYLRRMIGFYSGPNLAEGKR